MQVIASGPPDHRILAFLPHAAIVPGVLNMIHMLNKGWEWLGID